MALDWVAVSSASAVNSGGKTCMQIISASGRHTDITKITIGFSGADPASAGVLVQLIQQSSAGTMSAVTCNKRDVNATGTVATTASDQSTGEPTGSVIVDQAIVHPVGFPYTFPLVKPITLSNAARLGIKCTHGSLTPTAYISVEGTE